MKIMILTNYANGLYLFRKELLAQFLKDGHEVVVSIPFDENSIRRVTVKIFYLKPMYYEEYKNMKTTQIAEEVKRRIDETIAGYTQKEPLA